MYKYNKRKLQKGHHTGQTWVLEFKKKKYPEAAQPNSVDQKLKSQSKSDSWIRRLSHQLEHPEATYETTIANGVLNPSYTWMLDLLRFSFKAKYDDKMEEKPFIHMNCTASLV